MNIPENTTQRDPLHHLVGLMGGSDAYITGMEADGQRQLVNSDRLPTRINGGSPADFEALGFKLGAVDTSDPLFMSATLPAGWRREAGDHDMWSYLVDELGRRRVAIFYKAAFYDRKASMSLDGVRTYAQNVVHMGGTPVFDETWCTPAAFVEALAAIRADTTRSRDFAATQADVQDPPAWAVEALTDATVELATIERLASQLEGTGTRG